MTDDELQQAVIEASHRAEVRSAVELIYADLDAQIAARQPICALSGKCCHFDEYGHRLYITTAELATFVHELSARQNLPIASHPLNINPAGCTFQIGKACGVHPIRPFGCRIFFCDPTSTDWQQQQYERLHQKLKILHEQLGVPYAYVEWRYALRLLQPA
jgi:Fe-S-cluster containining protein